MNLTTITKCKECGSSTLTWHTRTANYSSVQEGRLRSHEVTCEFFLGCDNCSETLAVMTADMVAEKLNTTAPPEDGRKIKFGYTNYKGEFGTRTVTPVGLVFQATEYHPEQQWLMVAFDHDKQAERRFALKDIQPVPPAVIDLDLEDWARIQCAADASNWMPPEYMRNEWVADVCEFLRNGNNKQEGA